MSMAIRNAMECFRSGPFTHVVLLLLFLVICVSNSEFEVFAVKSLSSFGLASSVWQVQANDLPLIVGECESLGARLCVHENIHTQTHTLTRKAEQQICGLCCCFFFGCWCSLFFFVVVTLRAFSQDNITTKC